MARKALDLTGKTFGRLKVIRRDYTRNNASASWLCLCECGNEKIVFGSDLNRGYTKSCGCYHKDKISSHELSKTKEYKIWNAMIFRCTNPKAQHYHRYGGRGVTVCERWLKFENFYEDMGPKPSDNHSIERMDNDKGYYPDNCKWATRREQYRNRGVYSVNSSGYAGVGWKKSLNKWVARIKTDKKDKHIGVFDTFEEAVQARKEAEQKYWSS